MDTRRARVALVSWLLIACNADSNQTARNMETSDARDAAMHTGGQGARADGGGALLDAESGARDASSPDDAAFTRDGSHALDGAPRGEGDASDAQVAQEDAAFQRDPFKPPENMPWAGQCTPGLHGTFQMRERCDDSQEAALQAAAIGPSKAFSFGILSYALETPMQAGRSFTFSITASSFGPFPMHIELWGADAACGSTKLERLSAQLTPGGIVCATMTPSAPHTHLLLVMRTTGGWYTDVHSECPDGACVRNTGTVQEWPGKDQPFCDPQQLASCEVCAHDDTCTAPAYADRGDGTVTSSCCGLTWQKVADAPPMRWDAAESYCRSLTTAGGGFRLPTFAELHSLVKAGSTPAIDASAFPDTGVATATLMFWSATRDYRAELSSAAWAVYFGSGTSISGDITYEKFAVRCVR